MAFVSRVRALGIHQVLRTKSIPTTVGKQVRGTWKIHVWVHTFCKDNTTSPITDIRDWSGDLGVTCLWQHFKIQRWYFTMILQSYSKLFSPTLYYLCTWIRHAHLHKILLQGKRNKWVKETHSRKALDSHILEESGDIWNCCNLCFYF